MFKRCTCFKRQHIVNFKHIRLLLETDRSRKKLKEGSLDEFKCWLGSNNPSNVMFEGYLNDPFYLWFMGTRCGHISDIIFLSSLSVASLTTFKILNELTVVFLHFILQLYMNICWVLFILLILLNDRKNSCYDRVKSIKLISEIIGAYFVFT